MASPKIHDPSPDDDRPKPAKIGWDSVPPPEHNFANYRLVRVPVGRATGGVLLCRRMIGTHTHFYRKRTTPCTGDRCPACADGNSPRWYGYFAIWNPITKVVSILELPGATARALLDRYEDWTDWRGCTIVTERVPNKPNGRVHAILKDTRGVNDRLPDAPPIDSILAHMWEQSINTNDRHEGTR